MRQLTRRESTRKKRKRESMRVKYLEGKLDLWGEGSGVLLLWLYCSCMCVLSVVVISTTIQSGNIVGGMKAG